MTKEPGTLILKRDTRGRVRVPRERREALLEEFGGSGLSAMKFSAMVGVRYPTFAGWLQQRRRSSAANNSVVRQESPIHLVEAVPEGTMRCPSEAMSALRVHLPGGAFLELTEGRQAMLAAQLLKALA